MVLTAFRLHTNSVLLLFFIMPMLSKTADISRFVPSTERLSAWIQCRTLLVKEAPMKLNSKDMQQLKDSNIAKEEKRELILTFAKKYKYKRMN